MKAGEAEGEEELRENVHLYNPPKQSPHLPQFPQLSFYLINLNPTK